MLKYSFSVLMLLVAFLCGGCTADEKTPSNYLELAIPEGWDPLPCEAAGGFFVLEVKAGEAWTAQSDQPWCHLGSASGGAGTHQIDVILDENTTYGKRTAVVTVSTANCSRELTVTQKQNDALLTDSPLEKEVPSEGEEFTVELETNVDTEVIISCFDDEETNWLEVVENTSSTKSLTKRSYTVKVKPNGLSYNRKGTIMFSPASSTAEPLHVRVTQLQKDFIRLDKQSGFKENGMIDVLGTEIAKLMELHLSTNVPFIVLEKPDWVEVSITMYGILPTYDTSPECSARVRLEEVQANMYEGERRGTLLLGAGGAELSVELVQESSCFPTEGLSIDMGQDVYWAGWNLGAEKPADYGSLFSRPDAASADWASEMWGKPWRLPTEHDLSDLVWICPSKKTYCQGVFGVSFTSPVTGNCLFIPAAGSIDYDGELLSRNENVYIWGSTLLNHDKCISLWCRKHAFGYEDENRVAEIEPMYTECALSVRPVCEK
ncbi:BACON domain-containing protein [Mediterranea massiliensis]|uniref:BACON domain-containing protein n=1 Tax=Mediterranea massiliensis TaxID=1841865 RepID=UPI0025A3E038|nr:BACON domain-containing protein [Mediterranea massiliensis]MDM8338293.1 BACON domain-containing protein [Mediterranea massiliensis]